MKSQDTQCLLMLCKKNNIKIIFVSFIKIKNLYKIYGSDPHAHLSKVKNGMSKQQLRQMHDHVLALNNINLHIMPKTIGS